MNVYEIENLSFRYGPSKAGVLAGIDLSIEKGEFIGITGPTGAGKSTFLKCLNGIIPHFQGGILEGNVLLNHNSIMEKRMIDIAHCVGSVFDDPESQIVSLDVEQELVFALENIGLDQQTMEERVTEALQMTGISHLRHSKTAALSGGQKQRVAIAASLALKPQVLVLDEPTSELDPSGTKAVFEVLNQLNRELGMTIIVATQKTDFLARYASRILIFNQGKIVLEGKPQAVFAQQEMLKCLGVRVPQVAELAYRLQKNVREIPLTVAEGLNYIQRCL